MQVNKIIETPEGIIKFEGELTGDELEVVIGAGLNYLMHAGALPIVVHGDSLYVPEESREQ